MAEIEQPVIDRASRDIVASLIRRFRDGEITNDQLEEQWPPPSEDKAIRALSSMIWYFYDDMHEHTLTGKYALTPEAHDDLTRYAHFADSALPYEWPQNDFVQIGGLGWRIILIWSVLSFLWLKLEWLIGGLCTALSIGAALSLDRWLAMRSKRFVSKLETCGDLKIWPFLRRSDFKTIIARQKTYSRSNSI